MKLVEIFSQLTYGELSNVSLGGVDLGEINESNYDRVLSHINLGLTALYKRFPLKEDRLVVPLEQGKFTYPLVGDIHKVERVYTEAGYEFSLNDEASRYSITTPSASVLRVPPEIVANGADLESWLKTTSLEVVYRANHPIIVQNGSFNAETYEVELPYSHLEPLLLFVASRVNNPIGMTNEFHAGNSYAAKYEQACQQLEQFNLRVDQGSQPDRIRRNGWV